MTPDDMRKLVRHFFANYPDPNELPRVASMAVAGVIYRCGRERARMFIKSCMIALNDEAPVCTVIDGPEREQ